MAPAPMQLNKWVPHGHAKLPRDLTGTIPGSSGPTVTVLSFGLSSLDYFEICCSQPLGFLVRKGLLKLETALKTGCRALRTASPLSAPSSASALCTPWPRPASTLFPVSQGLFSENLSVFHPKLWSDTGYIVSI